MKKAWSLLVFIGLLSSGLGAIEISAGAFFGPRTVTDDQVRNAFGNGTVYVPYAALNFWKGFVVGAGYEGGYSRTAKLGIYQESATLKITGYEIFLGYQLRIGKLCPYLKVGYGSFRYQESVDNPLLEKFAIDKTDMAMIYGGGVKFFPLKNLFIAGEAKFVQFSVRSDDRDVSLGGFRFLAGVGLALGI